MTEAQRRALVQTVRRYARQRLILAVQVTDNSAARIVNNIEMAAEDGADIAVIAPPYFPPRKDPDILLKLYLDAIDRSCLPIGIYDRATNGELVPCAVMQTILAQKKVIVLKDSSANVERMQCAVEAKRRRPALGLLNGDEFNCIKYLKAGYDGLLLGGAVFNGYLAGQIMAAARAGEWPRAERLQQRMNRMMWNVYGGRKIKCWLAGEKYLLTRMGIFRTWKNYPDYPLTSACRKAIEQTLIRDAKYLLP